MAISRIGMNSRYTNMSYNMSNITQQLNQTMNQLNGYKIQFGYQGSTTYNKTLGLDFNVTTLNQVLSVSQSAYTYTKNTDSAISSLVSTMDTFKSKLVQGANDIHSETSRAAIAKDLKALRESFLNLANTNIGGEYIFGGSNVTIKPFNQDGTYNGNNQKLEAVTGNGSRNQFNITGYELFFGKDSDHKRVITTNVQKFNQSDLHPAIMDKLHPTGLGQEVYIKSTDTLRDLVGDNDNDTTNNDPEVFYITGRKADGTPFKSKFAMDVSYTDKSRAVKVQDLLDRIGREFGNTDVSQVVDVRLNEWGQIEIEDLTAGRSNIEFHMVSSSYTDPNNVAGQPVLDANGNPVLDANGDPVLYDGIGVIDMDDLLSQAGGVDANGDPLNPNGIVVNTYVQSAYQGLATSNTVTSTEDYYDHRLHTLPTTFRTSDNALAETKTLLSDIFPTDVTQITLQGVAGNRNDGTAGAAVGPQVFNIGANTTVQDLMDAMQTLYTDAANGGGGNVSVQFVNGRITVVDNNVSKTVPPDRDPADLPYDGASSLQVSLITQDGASNDTLGFSHDYTVEYDRVLFDKEGNKLKTNNAQIVRGTNEFATGDTKLSEVAGVDLNGAVYNITLKDVNGRDLTAEVHLRNEGSYILVRNLELLDGAKPTPAPVVGDYVIPLFNPHDQPPAVTVSGANNVTYQQLMDGISLLVNATNTVPTNPNPISPNKLPTGKPETLFLTAAAGLNADGNLNMAVYNTPAVAPANVQDPDLTVIQGQKNYYQTILDNANYRVKTSINANGQLEIADKFNSRTLMEFSMSDSTSSEFILNNDTQRVTTSGNGGITFHANNALVADDPHTNFFDRIDQIITSIEQGIYRPGATETYSKDLRNTGIQNSILNFDHLADHVNKQHTENGAQMDAFEVTIERNTLLKSQTEEILGETIQADPYTVYMQLIQLQMNYQAMASGVAKINQLSLVNYL